MEANAQPINAQFTHNNDILSLPFESAEGGFSIETHGNFYVSLCFTSI